ncbi:hypothetical protein OIDMADRAFT_135710 [Oidiodendron maius Zn]|uniref:FAD-binding domain-containing protein n=1 Tax=Oidiodendron maius (strain Zn) TaxID=913774 RepID=A0A0C3GTT9_OIDMZ|nr:hypothetical protein OIDMADRAFT_135710 [Oidiodendron maius Zn]
MPQQVDVFICGSGSAGLCAATWLARCGIRCKIVDSRSGPLERGQADGVQTRSVEIFESFGISEELLREGYHVHEFTFWNSDGKGGGIERTRRAGNTSAKPGSHQPRIMLNQARVHGILLEAMNKFNGQEVDYGCRVLEVTVDEKQADYADAYPVTLRTERDGKEEIFEAKYVLGCDGAHSTVRRSLGFNMIGDSSDSTWGVMDIFPLTNFPDIRKVVVMKSDEGSLLIIPREGGSMVRFYVQLPPGILAKNVKLEDLQSTARKILRPYQVDFAGTFWWSSYSVGQRLADQFSKDNRVFLAGDACHTHSPKAGQGMNVSLQDGYNIGWKIASILKGQTRPELLKTYNIEREKVAATLIDFDRVWAKQISSTGKKEVYGMNDTNGSVEDFSDTFVKADAFRAGLTLVYDDSSITRGKESLQHLATNLKVGMRFPSTQVIRFCDAKAMQLAKALPADGRWRIMIFGGDIQNDASSRRLNQLGEYIFSDSGPVQRHLPRGSDIDTFIEVILVLYGERVKIEQEQIPECFAPVTGKWRIKDLHKTYIDDESYNSGHGHAYDFYGVHPEKGAVTIIRPDQYISIVVDIENHRGISEFFGGFALDRS